VGVASVTVMIAGLVPLVSSRNTLGFLLLSLVVVVVVVVEEEEEGSGGGGGIGVEVRGSITTTGD